MVVEIHDIFRRFHAHFRQVRRFQLVSSHCRRSLTLRLRYDDGARSLGKYCQPNELYLADRRARSCLEFVRMRLEFRNATAMLCGCGGSHDADPATV